MTCHQPVLDALHDQGVRLTAQRALILEDLFHHAGHRTAEDIYQSVGGRLPGLNRATVYRTLELLQGARVVAAFTDTGHVTEFELMGGAGEGHHHLHCRVCGSEAHLEPEPVEAFIAEITRRHGFRAELDHLCLTGLCASCARAQRKAAPEPGLSSI